MKKKLKVTLIITISLCLLLGALWAYPFIRFSMIMPVPSVSTMKKTFEKNQANIHQVSDVLQTLDFDFADIHNTDKDYHLIKGYYYPNFSEASYTIGDENVLKSIRFLFHIAACDMIKKEENCIFFRWWCTMSEQCGIVYSMDGKLPMVDEELKPKIQQILEPLGYDNWYYYYSKWP